MRKIVVLGCGFAGYNAARLLEEELEGRRRVELTVVTDRVHFLFSPLLYSVATGELDITHATIPLTEQFAPTTRLVIDHVEGIDIARRVLKGRDQEIPFDYLIIAPGATVDWGTHEQWRAFAQPFKETRDGVLVRESVEQAFKEATAFLHEADALDHEALRELLTFVVIGAGATGVELAAELYTAIKADILPHVDEVLSQAFRFVLIDREDQVLPRLPEELRSVARPYLESIGMELRLGQAVTEMTRGLLTLDTGETIKAANFFWCGGVRGPTFLKEAGFLTDSTGCLQVEPTLRVAGYQGIYAAGECAAQDPDLSQTALLATQQGERAAKNLLADLVGRSKRPFEYDTRGDLVSLGRGNAAVCAGTHIADGKAAWLMYRLYHTAMMPRALKKARLLKDWVASGTSKFEIPQTLRRLEGPAQKKLPSSLDDDGSR